MDGFGGGGAVGDAEEARFKRGDEVGLVLGAAGEDDFVEAVEAFDEVGRSHFGAGEDAEFGRFFGVESRDEDAAAGDDVPGVTRALAEADRVKEKAPAGEDEREAEERDDAPPALEGGVFPDAAGAVIPKRAEDGPGHAVEDRGEAAQHEDVGPGASLPDDFFAGGEGGDDGGRHEETLDRTPAEGSKFKKMAARKAAAAMAEDLREWNCSNL